MVTFDLGVADRYPGRVSLLTYLTEELGRLLELAGANPDDLYRHPTARGARTLDELEALLGTPC